MFEDPQDPPVTSDPPTGGGSGTGGGAKTLDDSIQSYGAPGTAPAPEETTIDPSLDITETDTAKLMPDSDPPTGGGSGTGGGV